MVGKDSMGTLYVEPTQFGTKLGDSLLSIGRLTYKQLLHFMSSFWVQSNVKYK